MLTTDSQEFKMTKWYIDTEKDNKRIEIKGAVDLLIHLSIGIL